MTDPTTVLIIDDDEVFADMVRSYFEQEGDFRAEVRHDGRSGAETALAQDFDLVLLDVTMPALNGFEALKLIRSQKQTPVIMLTARGDDMDRILGLEIGADDYVPKPCNLRELMARARAILRRLGSAQASSVVNDKSHEVDDLVLNTSAQQVRRAGEVVDVTGTEFLVLECLVRAAGEVVSKELISESALGRKLLPYDRSIDVHIGSLRKKLGPTAEGMQRIKTVRGRGYLYVKA